MNISWITPHKWTRDAACQHADPELFYPAPSDSKSRCKALEYCRNCPVKQQCLDMAIEDGSAHQHGVWGGMTQTERVVLLRELNKEKRAKTS